MSASIKKRLRTPFLQAQLRGEPSGVFDPCSHLALLPGELLARATTEKSREGTRVWNSALYLREIGYESSAPARRSSSARSAGVRPTHFHTARNGRLHTLRRNLRQQTEFSGATPSFCEVKQKDIWRRLGIANVIARNDNRKYSVTPEFAKIRACVCAQRR